MGELACVTQHATMKSLQTPTLRGRQLFRDAESLEISKGASNSAQLRFELQCRGR